MNQNTSSNGRSASHGSDGGKRGSRLARRLVLKPILSLACRAMRKTLLAVLELEYRFHRFVISTAGTKVMQWLSIPGHFFYAKCEGARVVLNQVVAGKISIAFFKLANLFFKVTYASQRRGLAVGSLRGLLVHSENMCTDLRELNRQFIGRRADLCFIERFYRRLVCTEALCKA